MTSTSDAILAARDACDVAIRRASDACYQSQQVAAAVYLRADDEARKVRQQSLVGVTRRLDAAKVEGRMAHDAIVSSVQREYDAARTLADRMYADVMRPANDARDAAMNAARDAYKAAERAASDALDAALREAGAAP